MNIRQYKDRIKLFFLTPKKIIAVGLSVLLLFYAAQSSIKAGQHAYFDRALLFLSYRLRVLESYSFHVLASTTLNDLLSRYAHASELYQVAEWNTPFSEYLEGVAGSDNFVRDVFFFPIPNTAKSALTMRENLSFSEKNILRAERPIQLLLHSKGHAVWFTTEKGLFSARLIRNLQNAEPIGALCVAIDVLRVTQSIRKNAILTDLFVVQDNGTILFSLNENGITQSYSIPGIPITWGHSDGKAILPHKHGIFFSAGRMGFISQVSKLTDGTTLYLVSAQNPIAGILLLRQTAAVLWLLLFAVIGFFFLQRGRKRPQLLEDTTVEQPLLLLSPQEYKICTLIAAGRTNKEIAWELNLKEQTIKNYTHKIYQKLGISGRVSATLFINKLVQKDSV